MESQTSLASTPARVNAFRDEYGDPRPPDISRKITACVSCRKHKVKCDVQDAGVPCTRCKKRSLSCAVKKSLQMLLEDDASWKDRIDEDVSRLTAGMTKLAEHLSMPELLAQSAGNRSTTVAPSPIIRAAKVEGSLPPTTHIPTPGIEAEPWNDTAVEDCGPAAVPASFVSEVTKHSPSARAPDRVGSRPDIVSRGILTQEQAESLFNVYVTKHDNYIYSVLEEGSTFVTVRNNSPLLLAAICAVASLHVLSPDIPYERCYEEFIHLSTAQVFSPRNSLDDIRALCIGAFWLPDLSWILVGTAVRMSTEMQLHRAYRGAIAGDRKSYIAARLYYLVHVCDHQFSIAYGRPPLTGEHEAVLAADLFLTSSFTREDDARLISQVKHWSISSNVFATFGTDIQHPVPSSLFGKLQRFNLELDTFRLEWNEKFKPHNQIGNYPRKGVGLHYHFAKLYLCSHAFRGVSTETAGQFGLSLEMREVADMAVLSATSILRNINTDIEFQSFMSDLPLYFDTMIAFASVFLFRISTSYSHVIQVDTPEILRLLRQSVSVLEQVASKIRPAHLLARITEGLRQLLIRFEEAQNRPGPTLLGHPGATDVDMTLPDAMEMTSEQYDWTAGSAFDGFSMGNYDLLSNHQMASGFDMWPTDYSPQQNSHPF